MKKVLLIGSQHGNELLGDALRVHLTRKRKELLPYVAYKTGNLRARRQGQRFTESDLNRSYNGRRDTYEERRASRILQFIKRHSFGLVLDLHTTTCDQPPCLIVSSVDCAETPFLRYSSFKNIVHMRHEMVESSLIGTCRAAVSIEVNKYEMKPMLLDRLCDDIARFIEQDPTKLTRTIYQVDELLAKQELDQQQAAKLKNFRKSDFGFTPVLVGENSYKKQTSYLGFKACKVYKVEL